MRILSDFDLNLLVVLRHLLQERSVAKAAKRLNITPSAVSKALAKLRKWFNDPLFLRGKLGLEPTGLALGIASELGEWFRLGDNIANSSGAGGDHAVFRVAMESTLYTSFIGEFPLDIYRQYPSATVKMMNWDYHSMSDLISGDVDLGICSRETHFSSLQRLNGLPYYIDHEILFSDRPVAFVRCDHPALKQSWNLSEFLACQHVSVTWEAGDKWALDSLLASEGLARQVPVLVSSYEHALFLVSQPGHNLIAVAPSYCGVYALRYHSNLCVVPLPFEEAQYQQLDLNFVMLWHKRNNYEGKVTWLRKLIRSMYASSAVNNVTVPLV